MPSSVEQWYKIAYFPRDFIARQYRSQYNHAIRETDGVYATSPAQARRLLKQRNLPDGQLMQNRNPLVRRDYRLPSSVLAEALETRRSKYPAFHAMHGCTFLSYMAHKADVVSVDALLSDFGFLHQVTHCIYDDRWMNDFELKQGLMDYARQLELRIPGLLNTRERASHKKKLGFK